MSKPIEKIAFEQFGQAFPAICRAFGTSVELMASKSGSKSDAPTRQRLIVAARLATDGSYPQIGRLLNRDQSTVQHAFQKRQDCPTAQGYARKIRPLVVAEGLSGAASDKAPKRRGPGIKKKDRPRRLIAPIAIAWPDPSKGKGRAKKMLINSPSLGLRQIADLSNLSIEDVKQLQRDLIAKGQLSKFEART